jgi:putative ABC transport system substrate-binding protein
VRRREFIAVVGLSAVSLPLATRAQQPERAYRVAFVAATSPVSEFLGVSPIRAFLEGMRELGYVQGKNLVVEWRSAEGKWDDLRDIIRQLVAIHVDVIVSPANPVIKAAKSVTQTIPVVMIGIAIPVEFGFVQTLARPGGNITGLSFDVTLETSGKRLELLKELAPHATRLAWLGSSEAHPSLRKFVEETTQRLGFKLLSQEHTPNEFSHALALMKEEQPDVMFVGSSVINFANRQLIMNFAAQNRLPAVYTAREFVDAGGLISYGPDFSDLARRSSGYVDKILKGAKAADLPVQQPTKFELVINLKTAKALGLTVPPTLLTRADEVIE